MAACRARSLLVHVVLPQSHLTSPRDRLIRHSGLFILNDIKGRAGCLSNSCYELPGEKMASTGARRFRYVLPTGGNHGKRGHITSAGSKELLIRFSSERNTTTD